MRFFIVGSEYTISKGTGVIAMKYKYKLAFMMCIIGMISTIFILFIYNYYNREINEKDTLHEISYSVQVTAEQIENEINKLIIITQAIASTPTIRKNLTQSNNEFGALTKKDRVAYIEELNNIWVHTSDINDVFIQDRMINEVGQYLQQQQQQEADLFGEVFVTNKYGVMIATTKKLTTLAHSQKYWWEGCYSEGEGAIYIDDRGFDQSVGAYVLGIVVPIYDDGNIIGILKSNYKISELLTKQLGFISTAQAEGDYVVIRSNGIIVSKKDTEPLTESVNDFIIDRLSTEEVVVGVEDGLMYGAISIKINDATEEVCCGDNVTSVNQTDGNSEGGWYVIYTVPVELAQHATRDTLNILIIVSAILLFCIVMVSLILGSYFAKPIAILRQLTKRVGAGDLSIRIARLSNDEIGDLSEDVNKMIINLDKIKNELIEKQDVLLEMIILANAASEAKGQFLANMSHEIRTPISAIIGMNYLLSQTNLDSKQVDYNDKIELASQNLLGIINDVLDFTKIEAGKIEMNMADFNIMDVMEHVVNILAMKAEDKALEFAINVSKDMPYKLYGDSMRLEQILINLIANAIKFTKIGEIVVEILVKTYRDDQVIIRFIVRDTGIGMSSEEQLNLFDEFEQAQKSISKEYGGTGLGLSISKKLTELMGGNIEVSSEKGLGSKFYIDLPFQYETDQVIVKDQLDLSSLKVMIVDSSHTAAIILESYMGLYTSDITIKETGEEAVEAYLSEKCRYDIIFIESKIADINAIDAARIIAKKDKDNRTKKVIVTTYLSDKALAGITESNTNSLLTKPVLPRKLFDLLDRIYGSNRAEADENNGIHHIKKDAVMINSKLNSGKKILIVEDNELNQQILYEMLIAKGYIVDIANDGLEAVERVRKQKVTTYDLIIMDLHMPKLNGYEATRLLYEDQRFRGIPILALTAEVLKDTKRKVVQSGMKAYLTKPINQVELFETIENVLTNQYKDKDYTKKTDDSNVLDVQEGILRFVNNEEAYFKIIRNFKDEYKNIYNELEACLVSKDHDGLGMKIHSLKGLTGNISANKTYRCLMRMNDVAAKGEYDQIHMLLDEFKLNLEELFIAIDYNLELRAPVETRSGTIDKVAFEFDVIQQMLDELSLLFDEDYGLVDKKVKELGTVFINTKYHDQWADLEKRIGVFDIEGARIMIEALLQLLKKSDDSNE